MLPLCLDQGVGVIPWSPLARGKLTRDWEAETNRSQQDAFGRAAHAETEQQDRRVVETLQKVARDRGLPRAQVALAWMLGKPAITAPIVGATKQEQLADAIAALDVKLSQDEIAALEAPYVPRAVHPMVPPMSVQPKVLSVLTD